MNQHQEQKERHEPDRTLIINIDLTRGVMAWIAVALTAAAILGLMGWGERAAAEEQAATAASTGMRQYYLSKVGRNGAQAESSCAEGYHMASLWEILDPSNLKYNTELGVVRDDSGWGPATYWGWVRTGYLADASDVAGRGNCNAWSSSLPTHYGTIVNLANGQWDPPVVDLYVWDSGTDECSFYNGAWCVED